MKGRWSVHKPKLHIIPGINTIISDEGTLNFCIFIKGYCQYALLISADVKYLALLSQIASTMFSSLGKGKLFGLITVFNWR